MKPIAAVPKGSLSKKDLAYLRANGVCVVEMADPSQLHLLDPMRCAKSVNVVQAAAVEAIRLLIQKGGSYVDREKVLGRFASAALGLTDVPAEKKPAADAIAAGEESTA